MTQPLTSIVIASYNHAAYLPEAIESALAQTAPVEVIVVDDGSHDNTDKIHKLYPADAPIDWLWQEHRGPSAARNLGLAHAQGEFVMFLDADDVIHPEKVARQLAAFTDDVGFVLCDTLIEDQAKGSSQLASERYGYAGKNLGGWIGSHLEAGNIIPIHAPLIRVSVLADIRFAETADGEPEDWRFWQRVAAVARCRYIPDVLATYRKKKTGRNRLPKAGRAVVPNIEQPLRLNLGCGVEGTRSWHPMPGMVNLDKATGWRFEDGLGLFADRSVAGITVSHSLMYVAEKDWPFVFSEFARVLAPGGVVRITEDDSLNPDSKTYGGWNGSEPAVSLMNVATVGRALARAGLLAYEVDKWSSRVSGLALVQAQHGDAPDVFFVEGVKVPGVLFSPHADDEALFASFTLLRYRPQVVICFPSTGDYGDTDERLKESRDACEILGASGVDQWDGVELVSKMRAYDKLFSPGRVWAPNRQASHPDHVAVALAAAEVFGSRVSTYHTYDKVGKVRRGRPVEFEPEWVGAKLRALARYTTQHSHPRAHEFFTWDLAEYSGTEAG